MQVAKIETERRTDTGRRRLQLLRAQGRMPAVIYGLGGESIAITLGQAEFEGHVRHHHRVFKATVDGRDEALYLQAVVWEPTSDRPIHADFKRIDMTKPITTKVEVVFLGHPVGLSKGGRTIHDIAAIDVTCLPLDLPESIEINIGHLEIDMKVLAKELPLPQGVKLAVPEDAVVCHVILHVEKVEEAPVAAVAAEGAEGAAPAEGAEGAAAPAAGAAPAAAPAKDAKEKKDKK